MNHAQMNDFDPTQSINPMLAEIGRDGPRVRVRPLGWVPLWVLVSWVFASVATDRGVLEGDPSSVALRVLLLALLAVSVLAHELGHAVVWTLGGHDVRVYVSPLLGACMPASGDTRLSPRSELVMLAAGPLANLTLAGVVSVVARQIDGWNVAGVDITAVAVGVNVLLFAGNLLPVLPLDGGRILHTLFGLLPEGIARSFGHCAVATASLIAAALALLWMVGGGRLVSVFDVLGWAGIALVASLWLVDPARELLARGRWWRLGIALLVGSALGAVLASLLQRVVPG